MSPLACTLGALALIGAFLPVTRISVQDPHPGYTDTPLLPDGWHVHDANRPRPPVVDPGVPSMLPAPAPSDAIVLFDGKNLDAFSTDGKPARWELVDGAVQGNRTGDLVTKAAFGDCQLHVEWCTPNPPHGDSQGRGNSGVFFFARYEVQVLDSYQNETYADGQASAIYGQKPPLVNASRKPGEWQAYDIVFVAPRFADGKLQSPARVTVFHNGVLTQLDEPLLGATQHRALAGYEVHGDKGPIKLQDHGDPIRYRNIWVRPLQLQRPAPK